jgi:DNA-directed RNA polymerase subunit F
MPFTEAQETLIKELLPELLKQLADMQEAAVKYEERFATLETKYAALEETVLELDGWRTAIRLRVRQEKNAI